MGGIDCMLPKAGGLCTTELVLHGQTPFHTEGRGLGHGHRAVCWPTLWSAYQSGHSIHLHDP